ncbi:MAG: flavodoxin [Clostridiales bacterium]|nr:flavodoxin [Clostridiales bacterium]
MKPYGIFYGSATGTTREIAHRIAHMLDIAESDIHDVTETAPSAVEDYETLILGTSTWGNGELESGWYDFIAGLEAMDLRGKKIAIFGCGDETMSDTFNDGVGELHNRLAGSGAEFIGEYDVDGYHFNHSKAVHDGKGVGLLLDEVNHPELTSLRLRSWVGLL